MACMTCSDAKPGSQERDPRRKAGGRNEKAPRRCVSPCSRCSTLYAAPRDELDCTPPCSHELSVKLRQRARSSAILAEQITTGMPNHSQFSSSTWKRGPPNSTGPGTVHWRCAHLSCIQSLYFPAGLTLPWRLSEGTMLTHKA